MHALWLKTHTIHRLYSTGTVQCSDEQCSRCRVPAAERIPLEGGCFASPGPCDCLSACDAPAAKPPADLSTAQSATHFLPKTIDVWLINEGVAIGRKGFGRGKGKGGGAVGWSQSAEWSAEDRGDAVTETRWAAGVMSSHIAEPEAQVVC